MTAFVAARVCTMNENSGPTSHGRPRVPSSGVPLGPLAVDAVSVTGGRHLTRGDRRCQHVAAVVAGAQVLVAERRERSGSCAEFVEPDGPNATVTEMRSRSSLTEPRSFGPTTCTSALNEKLIRTRPQTMKQMLDVDAGRRPTRRP